MATPSSHLPNVRKKTAQPAEADDLRSEHAQTSLIKEFDPQCQQSRDRLIQEIAAIRQQSTLHLRIAICAAGLALGILAPAVFFQAEQSSLVEAGIHLLIRLPISLPLGAFSWFFLRLHSAAANHIRYYHNELTNIDLRFIALDRAESSELAVVIKEMAGTDRNPVLKRGETTTELEQSKIDPRNSHDVLAAISELLKRIK